MANSRLKTLNNVGESGRPTPLHTCPENLTIYCVRAHRFVCVCVCVCVCVRAWDWDFCEVSRCWAILIPADTLAWVYARTSSNLALRLACVSEFRVVLRGSVRDVPNSTRRHALLLQLLSIGMYVRPPSATKSACDNRPSVSSLNTTVLPVTSGAGVQSRPQQMRLKSPGVLG